MKPTEVQFAKNLQALAAPQCRRIVAALTKDSLTTTELVKVCKLTPASIDKHLDILVQAGLVKVRTTKSVKTATLQKSKFKPTLDWFLNLED